jgi:flagellar protein FliS
MEENNPKIKGENISKVMAIVSELDTALDHEAGGDIAANLSSLYQHIMYRLLDSNIKNDISGLDEAEHLLTEIKDGFELAIKLIKENKMSPTASHLPPVPEHKEGIRLAV